MDLKDAEWKGVNWIHRAEAINWPFWTWQWTYALHKTQGIYSLDEGLLASKKGQCFKEFVSSSFSGL